MLAAQRPCGTDALEDGAVEGVGAPDVDAPPQAESVTAASRTIRFTARIYIDNEGRGLASLRPTFEESTDSLREVAAAYAPGFPPMAAAKGRASK